MHQENFLLLLELIFLFIGIGLADKQLIDDYIEKEHLSNDYVWLTFKIHWGLFIFPISMQITLGTILITPILFSNSVEMGGLNLIIVKLLTCFAIGAFAGYAPDKLGTAMFHGNTAHLKEKDSKEQKMQLHFLRELFQKKFTAAIDKVRNKELIDYELGMKHSFWEPPECCKDKKERERRLRIVWEQYKYSVCAQRQRSYYLDKNLQHPYWTFLLLIDYFGRKKIRKMLFDKEFSSPFDWDGQERRRKIGSIRDRENDNKNTCRISDDFIVRYQVDKGHDPTTLTDQS